MKNLMVMAVVLGAAGVFAQEIGTEVPPPNNTKQQPTTYDNPYATPPPPANGTPDNKKPVVAAQEGPFSAGKGAFGVHAGIVGGGAGLTGSGLATSFSSGTLGISYFATDGATLLVDAGFGVGIFGKSTFIDFSIGVGVDIHFRTVMSSLRPLAHVGASFGLSTSGSDPTIRLGFEAGGGAEYFFNPSFSMYGRLLFTVPIILPPKGDPIVVLTTATPGVGATFYF